jgi:UDP-N-acetylmuramate--alanine ligase
MEFKGEKIHFIGIGGIGMSALAQYMGHQGATVTGSDRDPGQKVRDLLTGCGIIVHIGHSPQNVPPDADLVVYSDAVVEGSEGFVERLRAHELGVKEQSYFEALGNVCRGKKTVAVAGVHGKTTTTGMIAKILKDADASPTAIVGSIVSDFGSNYLPGDSDIFVVEADEYRAHLLEFSPYILLINNLEWDHTDFYPSLEAMQETFGKAIERVDPDGAIVTDPNNPNIAPLLARARARVIDYTKEPSYELRLPGTFNESNARAAAAAARVAYPSITDDVIRSSLASFQGTWRRFEYKGKTARGADVYDDYAHHPTAVKETLHALRAKSKGKIFVAFHPHLYSRTRDLLDEFAHAFIDADKVLIAPIFAAREKDDGTISSEILAERIRATGIDAQAARFEEIEKLLQNEPSAGDAVMTMGAGDIYKVADVLIAPK